MACFSIINNGLPKFLLSLTLLFSLHFLTVSCVEMVVGGEKGWVVPPAKTKEFYNDWASKNRFKVDDSLRFKYDKDSVLVVTKEEYEKCKSTHPIFFSNNGDTIFTLGRPGLFYFISGVSGHCERGLKMIIKVLEPESPPQSANQTASPPPQTSDAIQPGVSMASHVMIFSLVLFGSMLF